MDRPPRRRAPAPAAASRAARWLAAALAASAPELAAAVGADASRFLGRAAAPETQGARRLPASGKKEDRDSGLVHIPANETADPAATCGNRCYLRFGYLDTDCECEQHRTWYSWVCTKRRGAPSTREVCGMVNCGGCTAGPADATPAAAVPQVAGASSPAPAAASGGSPPALPPVQTPAAAAAECAGGALPWQECTASRCCAWAGFTCFEKDGFYAQCRTQCTPGIHYEEEREFWTPWSCVPLAPAVPPPATAAPGAPAPTTAGPTTAAPPETPAPTTAAPAPTTAAPAPTTAPPAPPTPTPAPTTAAPPPTPAPTTTTAAPPPPTLAPTTTAAPPPPTPAPTTTTAAPTPTPVPTTTAAAPPPPTPAPTTTTAAPPPTSAAAPPTAAPSPPPTAAPTTATPPLATAAPTTAGPPAPPAPAPSTPAPEPPTAPPSTAATTAAPASSSTATTSAAATPGGPTSTFTTSSTTSTLSTTVTTYVRPKRPLGKPAGYYPQDPALLKPSTAEAYTFYMYRVQGDASYPPLNQNMANLAGAMWYLHNEIVNNLADEKRQRRYGKTRIERWTVKTRATQPLADLGMNFGVRYAFDAGKCTGPFSCEQQFDRLGYFVGCNKVREFPTQQWAEKVFYRDATWYHLPGRCSTRRFYEHDEDCERDDPGGWCADPTGQGNCTYSFQPAGNITINELEGIEDFAAFAAAGGWEYNNQTDYGTRMSFWNDKYNQTACDVRTEFARALFQKNYPDSKTDEEMQGPPCDFAPLSFYGGAMPSG